MVNGFDEINNLLAGWLDGTFARPVKEVQRYRIYNLDDNRAVLVANTLGVSKDDLKVNMSGDILTIKGETTNKDTEAVSSVDYSFRLSKEKKVSKIEWKNADGFTYVYFYFEEPTEIAIKYVD